MAVYSYSGRDARDRTVTGQITAETAGAAIALLQRRRIIVSRLAPAAPRRGGPGTTRVRRARPRHLALFARQLSVMVGAGLPLVECLEILGAQAEDRRFGAVILDARADVEAGASLADALRRRSQVFDPLFVNMVAAGEAGGMLEAILQRLAGHLEKAAKVKSQLRAAMMYPASVLAIALLVVGAILWKVIPTFAALFTGLGAELPPPTRLVIALSDAFARLAPLTTVALLAGGMGVRAYYRTAGGRLAFDRAALAVPVIGSLGRKLAVARFCRTLSTLLGAGVSILDAFEITARTAGNASVEAAILSARVGLGRGGTVAGTLRQTGVFPPMVVEMVGVGERSGSLDDMLARIADFYEEEVEVGISGLLTLVEPLLVAGLGVLVGGIVISMYLPIFGLINALAGG